MIGIECWSPRLAFSTGAGAGLAGNLERRVLQLKENHEVSAPDRIAGCAPDYTDYVRFPVHRGVDSGNVVRIGGASPIGTGRIAASKNTDVRRMG